MATKKNTAIKNGDKQYNYFRIVRTIGHEWKDGKKVPIRKQFYGSSKGDAEKQFRAYQDEQLQKEYPEDRFFFICGADCLYTIEYWKCADRLFAACTVLAAVRGDADIADMQEKIDALEKKFGAQIRLLPFRRIEISSSEIRERRRKGLSVRYLVPDAVRVYMEEKGLYLDE